MSWDKQQRKWRVARHKSLSVFLSSRGVLIESLHTETYLRTDLRVGIR